MANNSIFNEDAEGLLVSQFCAKACEANSGTLAPSNPVYGIKADLGL